jgi:hypothetical protein
MDTEKSNRVIETIIHSEEMSKNDFKFLWCSVTVAHDKIEYSIVHNMDDWHFKTYKEALIKYNSIM